MKAIYFTLVLCWSTVTFSQQYVQDSNIEREVNEQLWKPFKKSFEARDWKTFNDLHTDDVLRINKWSGIKVGDEYKNRVKESYQRPTERKKVIDFWFEHRIYSESIGYEVGYYRIVYDEPGKDQIISYAQFHVVLRKEGGSWKIAQDWDTGSINGVEITEEVFAKGTPIDFGN